MCMCDRKPRLPNRRAHTERAASRGNCRAKQLGLCRRDSAALPLTRHVSTGRPA